MAFQNGTFGSRARTSGKLSHLFHFRPGVVTVQSDVGLRDQIGSDRQPRGPPSIPILSIHKSDTPQQLLSYSMAFKFCTKFSYALLHWHL